MERPREEDWSREQGKGTIVPRARLKVWSQGQPGPTSLTACAGAELQCAAPLWTAGGAVGAAFTGHLRGGEGEGQAPCAWWCLLSSPRELRLLGHPHPHLESSQAAPFMPPPGHRAPASRPALASVLGGDSALTGHQLQGSVLLSLGQGRGGRVFGPSRASSEQLLGLHETLLLSAQPHPGQDGWGQGHPLRPLCAWPGLGACPQALA